MCQCLSRRVFLALPVSLSLTPNDRPIEPHMRLPNAPPDRLTVALTFDACPGAFDERIADALVAARIPATIFVTGVWLRENPKGLAFLLAHRDLFAIENHGEWHTPPILGVGRMFGIPVAGSLADAEAFCCSASQAPLAMPQPINVEPRRIERGAGSRFCQPNRSDAWR